MHCRRDRIRCLPSSLSTFFCVCARFGNPTEQTGIIISHSTQPIEGMHREKAEAGDFYSQGGESGVWMCGCVGGPGWRGRGCYGSRNESNRTSCWMVGTYILQWGEKAPLLPHLHKRDFYRFLHSRVGSD